MTPPNVPGIPGLRLPKVREVDATSGAPHTPPPARPPQPSENIELRGRNWSLNIPVLLVGTIVAAFVGRQTAPVVPPDDTLRRDVRDVVTDVRAAQQNDRETRARQAQQEQSTNALRAEVASISAKQDILDAKLNRVIEEMQKR